MSATRTQVYLTEEQRQMIDRVARAKGVTMAQIIRAALDKYLADEEPLSVVLATAFGADPDVAVPSREEWDRG